MILSHPCRCLTSMVSSRLKTIEANGLSSEKLALTICIGSAMGILPFPWVTTLLCFLLAYLFRLNQIALQSLNYLLYPLQLVLLVPYCRLGAWLFPWGPQQVQDISVTLLYSHFTTAINMFGWIIIKAIAAWLITAPPAAVILYLVLILVIKKKASFSERQIS